MRDFIKIACTCLLLGFAVVAQAVIPTTERDALIALYNATQGAKWGTNTNWLGAPGTECTWFGVQCNPAQTTVIRLDIGFNYLSGQLPIEIGQLTGLTTLRLVGNGLYGSIPTQIGQLTQLQNLYLYDNFFTGAVPAEIGQLTALQNIDVSGNGLDSIPMTIGGLISLRTLDVSSNRLTVLPIELGNLSALQSLDVSSNKLTTLPNEIVNLGALQSLSASSNQLTYLPQLIGNISTLQSLNVANNAIVEVTFVNALPIIRGIPTSLANLTNLNLDISNNPLPASAVSSFTQLKGLAIRGLGLVAADFVWLDQMRQLTSLDLSSNTLSSLPASIGNLTNLTSLTLDNNQLVGLPIEIGLLTQLQTLSISNNRLSSLPTQLGNLSNLMSLRMYNNQLTSLPVELWLLTRLQTLDVQSNRLASVPTEIGNLSSLTNLNLGNNQLTSVPSSLGNLTSLRTLSLYNNLLTSLPTELGNLTNLGNLSASRNQLTTLPTSFVNLRSLYALDVSNNAIATLPLGLSGLSTNLYIGSNPIEISILSSFTQLKGLSLYGTNLNAVNLSWLSQLTQLTYLNLGSTRLTAIPLEVYSLPNLVSLFLYSNQIGGSIPVALTQLTKLSYLDLEYNQFTGAIPPELSQLYRLNYLYLDNNQLTGTLPSQLGSLNRLTTLDLSYNQLTGQIPPELGDLRGNYFFGSGRLNLNNNQLSGTIPSSLTQLFKHNQIRLENNNCLATTDPTLISFLNQKDPQWQTQNCNGLFANFTATPTQGYNPLVVNLNASGSTNTRGTIDEYSWVTSDGQTATGVSPSFTFATAGNINVALTIRNYASSKTASTSKTINVFELPVVTSVTPTTATVNQATTFTVTGSHLTSGMGFTVAGCTPNNVEIGAGSATQRSFQCTPSSVGTQAGSVKTSVDGINVFNFNIAVSEPVVVVSTPEPEQPIPTPPVAVFSLTRSAASAPATVVVDAAASSDNGSGIASYTWSASNGQVGSGAQLSFNFAQAGKYSISLTVTNRAGLSTTSTQEVSLKPKPGGNFHLNVPTASSGKNQSPLTVQLDASSLNLDDPQAVYVWQAVLQAPAAKARILPKANAYVASGLTTSMTLTDPGVYVISLTATDSQGKVYSDSQTVEVAAPALPKPANIPVEAVLALASGSFAEPNDTPEQATPILVNDAPLIHLLTPENVDWYVFYAQKDLNYTVEIPIDSVGKAINPALQLYDNHYQPLSERVTQTNTSVGVRLAGKAPYTGFYHIQVTNAPPFSRAGDRQDYSYRLRVFLTDAPQQGIIKGKVVDACGQSGINQATVTAMLGGKVSGSTFSFKNGEFGLLLNPNTYNIESAAQSFFSYAQTSVVDQTSEQTLDFYLSPVASCSNTAGLVVEENTIQQEQDAVAVYDSATGVLTVRDVVAGGNIYYAELQNMDNFRFQLLKAFTLPGTIHAYPAEYRTDSLLASLPTVFALGKTWKVQLKYQDGLFVLDHAE